MFKRALLAVNLSETESDWVRAVRGLVDPESGALILLHVVAEIEGLTGQEAERFYAGLCERARAVLDRRARDLGDAGSDLQKAVVVGNRSTTIVRFAEQQGCDLIVMGSHRLQPGEPGKGLWTTSQQVALLADCPVLLMR